MSADPNLQIMVSRDGGKTWSVWKQDYSVTPPVITVPPTEPTPSPPPVTDKKIGTIVPLYIYPNNAAWTQIASIAQRYPRVHVVATINPASGVGPGQDANYVNGIKLLKNNGITVLGYVSTRYGARPAAEIKSEIDRYKQYYPDLQGIFFDEMANQTGKEAYYADIDRHAKSKEGFFFTVGNPGAPQIESYFAQTQIDNIHIYENAGLPSVGSMKQAWMAKYPRSRFGVIPYGAPVDNQIARNFTSMVVGVEKVAGYVYVQTDTGTNPWDELSRVFEATIQELDRIAATEGTTTPVPPPTTGGTAPTPTPEKLAVTAVTASGDDGQNPVGNAIDGRVETRWSASGEAWIQADLGARKNVKGVGILWYKGNERRNTFNIQTSPDGRTFVQAYPKTGNAQSSGMSAENVEVYMFANPAEARYVRINGFGNNTSQWNSITDIQIYGEALPTSPPDTSNPPSPTGNDKFGVKMLYPTDTRTDKSAPWYVDMGDPRNSPRFKNLPSISMNNDGSFRTSASQVRLEAWSETDKKWLNVEITCYTKVVSGSPTYGLQQYSRGGHHYSDSSRWCEGSAMKGRFYLDGRIAVVKEVNHPAYCGNRGVVQATTKSMRGRWLGCKTVIFNITGSDGKTYVVVEQWIDDDCTDAQGNLVIKNNWQKKTTVQDRGGWSTDDPDFKADCPRMNKDRSSGSRLRDEILNMPGGTTTANLAAWRTDGSTNDWKFLSVREIIPPSVD